MYIVTNRSINESARGLQKLGSKPNAEGANELRLVEASKKAGRWHINILADKLDRKMKREIGLTGEETVYASQYVAQKLLKRVQQNKRNLLFFVHGFNNDFETMLERAEGFSRKYNVEVIAFSWPANGGGARGVASYRSDKRDARVSVGALDRCFTKIYGYLDEFNAVLNHSIKAKACKKYPGNHEARDQFITRMTEKACPFTVNMVLHSMGNYLYKHLLLSSIYRAHRLLFDNVIIAAADTNNAAHAGWVDRIQCRRRVYITINEDDSALMASRMKVGEEQKARLGHCLHHLDSRQAIYVDFTNAAYVKRSHAYFEGTSLRNKAVKTFFHKAFNGQRVEEDLTYDSARGLYKPK